MYLLTNNKRDYLEHIRKIVNGNLISIIVRKIIYSCLHDLVIILVIKELSDNSCDKRTDIIQSDKSTSIDS